LWDTQYSIGGPYTPGAISTTNVVGLAPQDYYWAVRAVTQTTKSQFSNSTNQNWQPAQPAIRKVCSDNTTTTLTYSNTYSLWAPNTRGNVLTCDYTPQDNGFAVGGKDTNSIQLDFSMSEYMTGTSTGLLQELWVAINYFQDFILDITYGPTGYLMVGGTNAVFTGTINGTGQDTFVSYPLYEPSLYFNSCANNGTRYVIAGDAGLIIYSDTGYPGSWTAATVPSAATSHNMNQVIWDGSKFVCVGGTFSPTFGAGTAYIMTSTDGVTWTERANVTNNNLNGVAYNGSTYLAIGDAFTKATSSDGLTWTVSSVGGGAQLPMAKVSWNSGTNLWVIAGSANISGQYYGRIFTTDSSTSSFTLRYSSGTAGTLFYGVAGYVGAYNDIFVVGQKGSVVTSIDGGLTWALQPTGYTGTFYCARTIGSKIYLMGDNSNAPTLFYDATTGGAPLELVTFWSTLRLFSYGSDPTNPYVTTIQPTQDQVPNNVPINSTYRTGVYLKGVPSKYFLVAGDLNNPGTPSTVYVSRKSIAITEYKG
jgi:hypothetical protein